MKCLGNIGLKNPLQNGGAFVMVEDEAIELWVLQAPEDLYREVCPFPDKRYLLYKVPCDKHREVLISDALREKLKDKLESNCPITRAGAYLVLVEHYGALNFSNNKSETISRGEIGRWYYENILDRR